MIDKILLNDKELANILSFSPSWVRKQRWLRAHGQPHILTIDPVMIGTSPRYYMPAVYAWVDNQITKVEEYIC